MLEIIPSILTNSTNEALQMIATCDGVASRVQIDIIDGVFANNKTIDPSVLTDLDTSVGLDFHLMVKEPVKWIEKCVNAGADRIIGQIEIMTSQREFIYEVQKTNLRVGLAINLGTAVKKIDPTLFSQIDIVLVMSVAAGFGGQPFNKSALEKIKELNEIRLREKLAYKICVDGGETEEVVDDTYLAGADEIVVGRSLFKGDLAVNIKKMKEAAIKQ